MVKKNLERGIKINGYCNKCGGIVKVKNQIDSLGNKIQTISCWNGHYQKVVIHGIEQSVMKKDLPEPFPFITFCETN